MSNQNNNQQNNNQNNQQEKQHSRCQKTEDHLLDLFVLLQSDLLLSQASGTPAAGFEEKGSSSHDSKSSLT